MTKIVKNKVGGLNYRTTKLKGLKVKSNLNIQQNNLRRELRDFHKFYKLSPLKKLKEIDFS